jgi:hypothetical protein
MSIPFIVRDDDLCAYATAQEVRDVYAELIGRIKVTFAVVPFIDPRGNSFCEGRGVVSAPISTNPELCDLLRNWAREGKAEIAMHGVTHRDDQGPEFARNEAPRIAPAAEYLASVFQTPPVTFVPPHNSFSKPGYLAVRASGMSVLGSIPFNFSTRPLSDLSPSAFLRRRTYFFRAGTGARYPFPVVVNGHAELSCYGFLKAHGIDDLRRALSFVAEAKGYLAIATHWWELRDNPHLKRALIDFLDQNGSCLRPVLAREVWQSALSRTNL